MARGPVARPLGSSPLGVCPWLTNRQACASVSWNAGDLSGVVRLRQGHGDFSGLLCVSRGKHRGEQDDGDHGEARTNGTSPPIETKATTTPAANYLPNPFLAFLLKFAGIGNPQRHGVLREV